LPIIELHDILIQEYYGQRENGKDTTAL